MALASKSTASDTNNIPSTKNLLSPNGTFSPLFSPLGSKGFNDSRLMSLSGIGSPQHISQILSEEDEDKEFDDEEISSILEEDCTKFCRWLSGHDDVMGTTGDSFCKTCYSTTEWGSRWDKAGVRRDGMQQEYDKWPKRTNTANPPGKPGTCSTCSRSGKTRSNRQSMLKQQ